MDEEVVPKRQSTFPLFSKYFTTHPQNVVQYAHNMRKEMEDFIQAFRKRIEIQNIYAKNLLQVSKVLDKYIKPGTELSLSFICSAFKVEHEQRSRQATELSESLRTQIQVMCVQILKNQTTAIKKMEKDIKKYYKQAQNCLENYENSLQNFEGISKEMEEMIITKNIMRFTTGIPQEKKVKLISKAMESIKNNKQYEKLYLGSVRDYNTFVGNYNKQITNQLDQAETMLRQQVVVQADCLRKLIVAEVSMFKNIEYDLLNISKQMEHLDTQKQIEIFVEEQKNSLLNKVMKQQKQQKQQDPKRSSVGSLDLEVQNPYFLNHKKILGKSLLSQSLLYVQEQYFTYIMSNKKNKKLRELIGKIWKNIKLQSTKNKEKIQNGKKAEIAKEQKNEKQADNEQINPPLQGVKQQQKDSNISKKEEPVQWHQQLKQIIASFRIVQPPVFILYGEKTEKKNNPEIIYQKFTQIVSIIALLWNSQEVEAQILTTKLKSLEEILSLHHLYRLIAYMFIEQYRLQHQVIIKSPLNSKVCGKIIKSVLKESHKFNDVFIIRGILGLIFTYYWAEDKTKKLLFLNPQIYYLDIWKKHDFWQAAIFETTFEQMSLFTFQKNQTQSETVLREKNIIFSQLASYCHYMVMLGVTTKNVRLIVGRYCRLYEMTQQQNKDLSKMITNTSKQYKQTSLQFSLKQPEKEKSAIMQ